jgi:uncharacterized protein (DUF927 family)
MSYKPPTIQVEEIKPEEGTSLPQITETKAPTNRIQPFLTKSNDKTQKIVKFIEEGYKNGYNIILHELTSKKPNWLGMKASDYKANLQSLFNEYMKNPSTYGYGVVVGKQLKNFNVISLDIDIDTLECKERISKELEGLLNKYEIKYYKEITKSERIHYYIILDKTTDKIENIRKLPYPEPCFKYKDGKLLSGEVELFTKKNKFIIVYDGIINDKEPFFTLTPVINNYQAFENFLDEWISKYKPGESIKPVEPIKGTKDKPIKEPVNNDLSLIPRSELKKVFIIFRKHKLFNGWEGIDKLYTAYCILENIPEEQIIEDLKDIWGEEYNDRLTRNLIQNTERRYRNGSILPSLGSIYYYINEALKNNNLEEHERELLKKVLKDIANKGYSDYKLPEYLKNAENIILDSSIEHTNKDGRVYYKESYFIEQNINGIKKVIYVSIIASEEHAIYKHHKLDKLKEIGIKADIIRLVKDGKIEAYEYLINDREIYKPSFNYSKIDDVIHEIELISMKYTMVFENSLYKRYLSKKIENYIKENGPTPCVIGKTTGWSEDLKFFHHYGLNDKYHELHQEHTLCKRRKALIKEKDKQHEIVKALLQEGKLLAVLLTASVASLFIKPFNISGITYIISGNSGAGKTTSALIATSLFYYSDDHLMDAQATKTGLELTISSLNSLPVLVDESALAGVNFSLNDLVFMVSSGKGKTRGRKDLTVDFKELKSNVFWTTEKTDIDELRRTGAFRRMMYLVVSSWDDFTSLFKAEDRINEQYAGCGIDYIKYLVEHMEDVKKAFKDQIQRLNHEYKEISTIALNLYSGLILLEAFYNTKFNELRKTINKLLYETKIRFIDSRDNVVIQFRDYIESITYQRFHIIDKNNEDEIVQQISRNETYGEYDKINGIYYLTSKGLKEIADKLEKNKLLLIKELEKANVLIAKNVPYYTRVTKQTIKVYKLKFSEMIENEPIKIETIEPEVVETEEKTSYEEMDIIQQEREQDLEVNIEELDIPF